MKPLAYRTETQKPYMKLRSGLPSRESATAILSRTLPFVLFMAFIAVDESARLLASHGWLSLSATTLYYLYPVKSVTVALLLYRFRKYYYELALKEMADLRMTAFSCIMGLLTFLIWIRLDFTLSFTGPSQGFNPMLLPAGPVRHTMTLFRVAGAVLVVPVMEELFWRSFMQRYLIDPDFESVPVGLFSWPSLLITVVLFGLEHQLLLAGMVAGLIYSVILHKTRSLTQCVLAHAVTNLSLAVYVLLTHQWQFW